MKSNLASISLTVAILLNAQSVTCASTGVASEITFPAGSSNLSGSRQSIALSESYAVVGFPGASYKAASGGSIVNAAGEVQIFSVSTGKFIRRLRSPKPVPFGTFGGILTVSGSRVYIVENEKFIHAYELTTGARVWTNSLPDDTDPELKSEAIKSLAVDGETLWVGMPMAWTIELPNFNQFAFQGLVRTVSCKDGTNLGNYIPAIGQSFCEYGSSLAVSSRTVVAGSPRRDVTGRSDCGMITFRQGSTVFDVVPADVADGDEFGSALTISRDLILVSAPKAEVNGRTDVGVVYLYDAKTCQFIKKITAPQSLPSGCAFGSSLASSGTLALIGTSGNPASGAMWLYDTESDILTPILASAPGKSNRFGYSISLMGSNALVCDTLAVGGTASAGRVHRVTQLGRSWGNVDQVASTKTAAPGLSGPLFASFGETAVSTNGKALHTAVLSGAGVLTSNNAGLWANSSGSLDLLIREGDLHSNEKLQSPGKAFFTQSAIGLYQARYVGKTQANLFIDNGTFVQRVLAEGQSINVNGMPESISRLYDVVACPAAKGTAAVNIASKVGTNNVTLANDSHIASLSVALFDEVRESNTTPIAGLNYGQITPRAATNESTLAFTSALLGAPTSSNAALFVKTLGMGTPRVVARKGDLAPGAGNARFSSFLSEGLGGSSTIFRASLTGGASGVTSGVWRQRPNGGIGWIFDSAAIRLGQAPGLATGVKFVRFLSTFVTDGDTFAFMAQVSGPGISSANDVGIWWLKDAQVGLLFREGDLLAGTSQVRIATIQRFDLSSTGHYIGLVSLTRCPTNTNQALLSGDLTSNQPIHWSPSVALRKGSFIDRPTPMPILSLNVGKNHLDATGSGSKGIAKQVHALGSIFSASFLDKTELLFGQP